jgi:uncharacterized membrane-anchored protein
MAEFLDRGRSGSMASTFLTRLQLGGLLVDGRVIASLYRSRISVGAIMLMAASALVAVLAALSQMWMGLVQQIRDVTGGLFG